MSLVDYVCVANGCTVSPLHWYGEAETFSSFWVSFTLQHHRSFFFVRPRLKLLIKACRNCNWSSDDRKTPTKYALKFVTYSLKRFILKIQFKIVPK